MSKLTYISSSHGDWCGIYIDNNLYTEGHSIPVHDWLYLIGEYGAKINDTEDCEVEGEYLDDCGCFPKFLADIPKDVFI